MEKEKLNFDGVTLTPEILDCIRSLQEVDTLNGNWWLNSLLDRLANLNELIVRFYLSDQTVVKSDICMQSLTDIQIIKDILMSFAAPAKENQP